MKKFRCLLRPNNICTKIPLMYEITKALSEKIAEALATDGYIVINKILGAELETDLYTRVCKVENLSEAKIGRGTERQKVETIRSDKTLWLEGFEESEKAYLSWMESLKQSMNQELYMGLADYEAHFAHYEKGAFYQKHVDVLRGSNKRLLTTVFYLTPHWKEGDGGELLIYDEEGENVLEKVPPRMGTMVVFLSDKFPHEVLPSRIDRYSIAGWFKGA